MEDRHNAILSAAFRAHARDVSGDLFRGTNKNTGPNQTVIPLTIEPPGESPSHQR